jgi:hypothetical protein
MDDWYVIELYAELVGIIGLRLGDIVVDSSLLLGSPSVPVKVTSVTRGASVTYKDLRDITMRHGSGSDVLSVTSLETPLIWNGYDGDDAVFISSIANIPLTLPIATQYLGGRLNEIVASATLHFGSGANRMFISDRDNEDFGHPALHFTNGSIIGFAPAPIYYDTDINGDFGNGIALWLPPGPDNVTITSTHRPTYVHDDDNSGATNVTSMPSLVHSPSSAAWTVINCGSGDDTVRITLDATYHGDICVNLEDGHDTLNGWDSSHDLVVNGGNGSDTITTGSGNDIIAGDIMHITAVNVIDETILSLGYATNGDVLGPVNRSEVTLTVTTIPSFGGSSDRITSNDGVDFIFGGELTDYINSGAQLDGIIGDFGEGIIENLQTFTLSSQVDVMGQDGDIIDGGSDGAAVIGGAANDTITIIDQPIGGHIIAAVIGDFGSIDVIAAELISISSVAAIGDGISGTDRINTQSDRAFILGCGQSDIITSSGSFAAIMGDMGALVRGWFALLSLVVICLDFDSF